MLGGLDEALAILELCSDDWAGLTVHALRDGDRVDPWETVMTIEGDYTTFAHLETVVLGTLARRTLIASNTARVVEAANGKPIIFMPARHDHHRVQTGDGYAASSQAPCSAPRSASRPTRRPRGGVAVAWARSRTRWSPPRGQHRARSDEVRRVGERRLPDHGARRLRQRLRQDGARCGASARPAAVGRPPRHIEPARRSGAVGGDGRLRPARRERAPRAQGALRARRGRLRARADRGFGRLHGREDRGVRAARSSGGRVRRRLVADPRGVRLHSGHRDDGRQADRKGGSGAASGPNARLDLVE